MPGRRTDEHRRYRRRRIGGQPALAKEVPAGNVKIRRGLPRSLNRLPAKMLAPLNPIANRIMLIVA